MQTGGQNFKVLPNFCDLFAKETTKDNTVVSFPNMTILFL